MDELLLVYHERSDNAHSLTPSATAVYDACRGGATLREVTEALRSEDDPSFLAALNALAELSAHDLVVVESGSTRRDILRKVCSSPSLRRLSCQRPPPAATSGGSSPQRNCVHCEQPVPRHPDLHRRQRRRRRVDNAEALQPWINNCRGTGATPQTAGNANTCCSKALVAGLCAPATTTTTAAVHIQGVEAEVAAALLRLDIKGVPEYATPFVQRA